MRIYYILPSEQTIKGERQGAFMSEAPAEQQEQQAEGQKQVSSDELIKRMERLESSNERLLDESKAWKAKYQSVKSEVEQRETEQMQETNDFKGLYEKAIQKAQSLEDEIKNEKKSALESTLKYEVAKNAKDAEDTDLVLAALKLKKKDMLGYDREAGVWKGVDQAIDDLRVTNPGLFLKEKPGMENGRPQPVPEKTVDELITDNPSAVLNEVLKNIL